MAAHPLEHVFVLRHIVRTDAKQTAHAVAQGTAQMAVILMVHAFARSVPPERPAMSPRALAIAQTV